MGRCADQGGSQSHLSLGQIVQIQCFLAEPLHRGDLLSIYLKARLVFK